MLPHLTRIFICGVKYVLLYNKCGNGNLKICNINKFIIRSLGWNIKEYEIKIIQKIKDALRD